MNEVEKMYSNVGLSNMWVERYNDGYYEHERYYNSYKEMINNMMKANDWTLTEAQEVAKRECKKEHPPFTAEKQLELIKWLSTKELKIRTNKQPYAVYVGVLGNDNTCFYGCEGLCLEQTLSELINHLWQSLTEEERKQIKEILE